MKKIIRLIMWVAALALSYGIAAAQDTATPTAEPAPQAAARQESSSPQSLPKERATSAQPSSGQARDSEGPAVPSDKALVYVYRYKQFVGGKLEPSVYCDDAQVARMDNGRYFIVKVDPGEHMFQSNDKQAGVRLNAKAGQKYFIRVEIASGFLKGHGRVILVAPEQGEYEIGKLKPLGPDKVINAELVLVPGSDRTRLESANKPETSTDSKTANGQKTKPAQAHK